MKKKEESRYADKENSENFFSDTFESLETIEVEITDTIDLHGFEPRDIKSVVKTYLQEAYAKGFRIVRIIHGKGIGVQREMVRKILRETDFVDYFKTADELTGGGTGATVVFFKTRD